MSYNESKVCNHSEFYILTLFLYLAFGVFFNHCQLERGWTTRQVRQWAQFISLGGASVALVSCSFITNAFGGYSLMVSRCLNQRYFLHFTNAFKFVRYFRCFYLVLGHVAWGVLIWTAPLNTAPR
jgi:hypothetical protein